MAYIKGYEYDIFISYSHLDNQKYFDQPGWVERFRLELNMLLAQRIGKTDAVKIWWDNRNLDGSMLFDQSIAKGIQGSAIMLTLTSAAYFKSQYCLKELDAFYNKAKQEPIGLKVGDRSRIVNVLLNNVPHAKWPVNLGGTTGFAFNDAVDNNDLGDPLDMGEKFKNQLKELRNALVNLINDFLVKPALNTGEVNVVQEEKKAVDSFTIYFAEVADHLRGTRKRTIGELEKKGFTIVYDVPPPYDSAAHDKAVIKKLQETDLAVHLLDQFPGKEIDEEEDAWYPQKQAALSLQFAKSQLIWVPAEMDINTIEEEPYKAFMESLENGNQTAKNMEYVRGAKSAITQEIINMAERLKVQQKQQTTTNANVAVLLDTHKEDQKYAYELSMSLLENEIQPFVNPQEDDPRDNVNMLGDRISQVSKLVFFYGKVDWKWVQKRVNAAVKLVVNNEYRIDEFFIFMLPPHKNPADISFNHRFVKVNVIDQSDNQQLDKTSLQEFFNTLKTVA
jgi:hypothetical protein